MYKSWLHELCRRRSWSLPEYTTVKDGPEHESGFRATVVVNGVSFVTPDKFRSYKVANNRAAKIAFDHFTGPKTLPQHPPKPPSTAPVPSSSSFSTSNTTLDTASVIFPTSSTMLDTTPVSEVVLQRTQQESVETHQAKETSLGFRDYKTPKETLHSYKIWLKHYAQKRNIPLPVYYFETEGPAHACRFRSRVTIDGKTYESSEFFPTLKGAESATAKVAFESLSLDEVQVDESFYKSILQELAQKEGYKPVYNTVKSGPPHMPTFVSTVEIKGKTFFGQEARTKKHAETNAAKIAYIFLTEGGKSQNSTSVSSGCQVKHPLEVSSSNLQSIGTDELQLNVGSKANLIIHKDEAQEDIGGASWNPTIPSPGCDVKEALKVASTKLKSILDDNLQQNLRPRAKLIRVEQNTGDKEADKNAKKHKFSSSDDVYARLRDAFPHFSSSRKDGLSSSTPSEHSTNSVMGPGIETAAGPRTLPRTPFPDDKWEAVKVNINYSQ